MQARIAPHAIRVREQEDSSAVCISARSTSRSRFAAIKTDWYETDESQIFITVVHELMHAIGIDHQDVARTARVKLAVEFDACLTTSDDDLVLVVVLMSRRVSARCDGVVTHRKGWSAILSPHHQTHRHSLSSRKINCDWIHFFYASLQHERQGSDYVLTVAKLRIKGFPLGAWQTNCWLVWMETDSLRPGWIIDTGDNPEPLLDAIRTHGITPQAILFTHAHLDHIMGLAKVIAAVGDIPRHAHPIEHAWFGDPQLNLSAFAEVPPVSVSAPTHAIQDGDELMLGSTRWRILHTPGHSPGSVSFVCDDAKVVIAGDTLFAGSVGRSDFPTSDPAALDDSLRRTLLALPDDYAVHPGHGPSTTIGRERRSNPFLQ